MPKSREPHGERVGHQVLDSLEIQNGLHLAGLKSGERPKGRRTGIFAVLVSVDFISEIGWPHGYVSGPLPNLQHKVAKSRRSISGRGGPWSSGPPMLDLPRLAPGRAKQQAPSLPKTPCWDLMMVPTAGSKGAIWGITAPE
ncbi:hypothetical protein CDV31_004169 [Fusarium ambrosium]|uniref:Uncharacterized protein n=1 Tax=Fusarium ambrosium TaxID=131363 RepID=A0A428URP6_9HYPO|nr:hypothetical protein CDV31_004169 [Fusarium ambrosium]